MVTTHTHTHTVEKKNPTTTTTTVCKALKKKVPYSHVFWQCAEPPTPQADNAVKKENKSLEHMCHHVCK
jgi:hypothetical protein